MSSASADATAAGARKPSNGWAHLVPAVLAAAVLLAAGIAKLSDPGRQILGDGSDTVLRGLWDGAPSFIRRAAQAFAVLEVAISGLLLLRRSRPLAARLLLVMCPLWALVVLHLQALGVSPSACQCFGSAAQMSYSAHFGVIAFLAALAMVILRRREA